MIIQIFPWLYVGSCISGRDLSILEDLEVKTVLNVHQHYDPKINTVNQYHFTLADNEDNDWKTIMQILDIIDKHRKLGKILVHCCAGMSRSPFIAISYLSVKEGIDIDKAQQIVAEKQPFLSVHPGLMKLLRKNIKR